MSGLTVTRLAVTRLDGQPPGNTQQMTTPRIRDTWLVRKHEALQLGLIYAAFTAVGSVSGGC